MIERNAYSALMRLAKQFPVVAITGPRQSGKSTLTKYVFPEKDAFCVMVRKTNKQFSEVYDKVSELAKEVIDNKYPGNDGGWIHFRVTDEASYADIVKIMEADLFPRTHKV